MVGARCVGAGVYRIPLTDMAVAIATLVVLALGVVMLPAPRAVDWPGTVTVAEADVSFIPAGNPVLVRPGVETRLRLTLGRDWPARDIPLLVLRNLGAHSATVTEAGRLIGRAGPYATEGEGAFQSRTGYFRLLPGLAAGTEIEVAINAGARAEVYPELRGIAEVRDELVDRTRFLTGIITILLTMAAASLLLYAATRERIVLIFAVYTFAQASYVAFATGEIATLPGLDAVRPFVHLGVMWSVALAATGVAQFVRHLTQDLPEVRWALKAITWFRWGFGIIALGGILGTALPGLQPATAAVGNVIVLLWSVYFMVITVIAARRGSRPALLMAFGWGVMWFATVARAGQFLRGEYSPVLDHLFPASMALAAISMAFSIADQWRRQRHELHLARHAAETDGLTGVLNRRAIESRLTVACADAIRRGQDLAVLFIDLDHFKAINDHHGHAVGDLCLQRAVEPIRTELRASDGVGRWGGEEFVVLLPGADLASAQAIAERIRQQIAGLDIAVSGGPLRLTASIGVAAMGQGIETADALVAAADDAVYAAKRGGRNRVETALLRNQKPGQAP